MSRPKVVLWRPMYNKVGHKLLEDGGCDVVVVDSPNDDELKQVLHGAKALWVRTPERVTQNILDVGRDLVIVSTSGFGTDNIDVAAATSNGIIVVNHRGIGRIPVSEHSIMLILAVAKHLVWGDNATRESTAWEHRSNLPRVQLDGKTVGIIGIGFIGSELSRKLKFGFRCKVLGYDPYVDQRLAQLADVEMCNDLHHMLRQSQILVLVPELTDETRLMIGKDELAALPKGAIVVNTGRGHVLDIDALGQALDSGHLFGAGLDVVFPEPLPTDHPLLKNPKVTFSPHIAGGTEESSIASSQSAADQILTALSGQMPRFPLNPEAWAATNSRRPLS
ncbi:MAG: NAD(P)-dependent oxidoreductase [Hyphomicrobiaceae bacterium]